MTPIKTHRKLLKDLGQHSAHGCIRLNQLLWSLTADEFTAACHVAEEYGLPVNQGLIEEHLATRQKYPDTQGVLADLRDRGILEQFPLASRPLLQGRQAEVYILLDYAEWVNCDPEFVLQIMEQIWQKATETGSEGYARLTYKNREYTYWSDKPSRNKCCFVAATLATYTQYAPSTCSKVFMAGLHSMAGGLYNFKRWGREWSQVDAGQFTFWGITREAMDAAHARLSKLSSRIYNGGWG